MFFSASLNNAFIGVRPQASSSAMLLYFLLVILLAVNLSLAWQASYLYIWVGPKKIYIINIVNTYKATYITLKRLISITKRGI